MSLPQLNNNIYSYIPFSPFYLESSTQCSPPLSGLLSPALSSGAPLLSLGTAPMTAVIGRKEHDPPTRRPRSLRHRGRNIAQSSAERRMSPALISAPPTAASPLLLCRLSASSLPPLRFFSAASPFPHQPSARPLGHSPSAPTRPKAGDNAEQLVRRKRPS